MKALHDESYTSTAESSVEQAPFLVTRSNGEDRADKIGKRKNGAVFNRQGAKRSLHGIRTWFKIIVGASLVASGEAQSKTWKPHPNGKTMGVLEIYAGCEKNFADQGTIAKYYEDGCTIYNQGLDCVSSGHGCYSGGSEYECCNLEQCKSACVRLHVFNGVMSS